MCIFCRVHCMGIDKVGSRVSYILDELIIECIIMQGVEVVVYFKEEY